MTGFKFKIGDNIKVEADGASYDAHVFNVEDNTMWVRNLPVEGLKPGQIVTAWVTRKDATYRFKGELKTTQLADEILLTAIECVSEIERHQRRAEYRTPCNFPVTIYSKNHPHTMQCRAYDISSSGIGIADITDDAEAAERKERLTYVGIETSGPFQPGEIVNCTFSVGGNTYTGKMIIRRCIAVRGGKRYKIGAQFVDMDYRDAKRLQKSIFKMQVTRG